jgi:hypothetical protein
VRALAGLALALSLPLSAGAQEQECPGLRVGETTYTELIAKLRAQGTPFRELPPDREAGTGRGIFVQTTPLCPGFGRPAQGGVHFFVPGSMKLAVMIVNLRFTPEGHWAIEQLLDGHYDSLPDAPADRVQADVLAPQITKTWTRDGLVVRLRRDAPDVPPLYSGVEYRRPDLVADMEREVAAGPGAR